MTVRDKGHMVCYNYDYGRLADCPSEVVPMPPELRICANPHCRRPYTTRHPHQRYCHPTHRPPKAAHYTADEKKQRAWLHQHPPNGDPCPRCGRPMTLSMWQAGLLDTGHVVDKVLGGTGMGLRWEHRRCGRSAGATLGNGLRRRTRTPAW